MRTAAARKSGVKPQHSTEVTRFRPLKCNIVEC
jgi:hypothetical protein